MQSYQFEKSEFNQKCNDLLNNGFKENTIKSIDGIKQITYTNDKKRSQYYKYVVTVCENGIIEYSLPL